MSGSAGSRFTTWAFKFVILEVSTKIGRHFWQRSAMAPDGHWLIGYTGAVTDGVYGQVAMGGGTSGASPIVAGLEADAKQASGHAVGFANPAIYQLAGTPAIHDILPVNLNDPPLEFGPIPDDLQSADNYLIALGQDDGAAPGYDAVTGVGAVTPAFVTAFGSTFQAAHGRR